MLWEHLCKQLIVINKCMSACLKVTPNTCDHSQQPSEDLPEFPAVVTMLIIHSHKTRTLTRAGMHLESGRYLQAGYFKRLLLLLRTWRKKKKKGCKRRVSVWNIEAALKWTEARTNSRVQMISSGSGSVWQSKPLKIEWGGVEGLLWSIEAQSKQVFKGQLVGK